MADMAKTIALIGILGSIIVIITVIALLSSGYLLQFLYKTHVISKDQMERWVQAQGEEKPSDVAKPIENDYRYETEYEWYEFTTDLPEDPPKKKST